MNPTITTIPTNKAWLATHQGVPRILFQSRITAADMKNIGFRYDNKALVWYAPPLISNLMALVQKHRNLELSEPLQKMLASDTGYYLKQDVSKVLPSELWEIAMWHQREALQRMYNNPWFGYLLSLGKGLGKTFTSIAFAEARKAKRVLIVCVKSLVPVWRAQIRKWVNQDSADCRGSLPKAIRWNVTNFDTLRSCDYTAGYAWDLVIVDESVLIQGRPEVRSVKNPDQIVRSGVQRTADIGALRAVAKYMLLLSGSPVSKHADGLWAQFNILFPSLFTSYWRFTHMYCETIKNAWGEKVVGNKDGFDAGVLFRDIMYRVTTEQVKGEVNILYEDIAVEPTAKQIKVYEDLMQDFEAELDGAEISTSNKLSRIVRLAQTISNLRNLGPEWPDESAKEDMLLEIVGEYQTPAIIWTHWRQTGISTYGRLAAKGFKVGLHNGLVTAPDDAIEEFTAGRLDYLILSLETGKFGFTFTAKTAFYLDKFWNADTYGQSLSRISGRLGVDTTPVVVSLISPRSVDDLIAENLAGKLVSISEVSNESLIRLLGGLKYEQR